jgi:phage-related holin
MDTLLAMLPQGTEERAGAMAGAGLAVIAGILGPHGPELLVWVLAAMGVDLAAGLLRALVVHDEDVSGARFVTGVLKKLLMLTLVFPAAMVDRVAHISGVVSDGVGPVTFAIMVGLMMYEGASITRNVKRAVGESTLTMGLLRAIDTIRYGGSLPDRRHYDKPDTDPMEEVPDLLRRADEN